MDIGQQDSVILESRQSSGRNICSFSLRFLACHQQAKPKNCMYNPKKFPQQPTGSERRQRPKRPKGKFLTATDVGASVGETRSHTQAATSVSCYGRSRQFAAAVLSVGMFLCFILRSIFQNRKSLFVTPIILLE